MNKYIKAILVSVFICIVVCFGYFVGLYNGMNSIFVSETTLTAYRDIQILNYIDDNSINKAKSVLSTSLEAEIAAINDITQNEYKLSKKLSLFNHYKTMISYNTSKRIDNLLKKYKKFITDIDEKG